tara:strand:+ start:3552 stop:4709 length:1158 start_codon:yes stop_codon:yes gene_type:complete
MGHRAYYLDETQDGWNVYYSNWGAKELFYDGAKNDDVKLGRSMNPAENGEYFDITSPNKYELEKHYSAKELNTTHSFEKLIMIYGQEEALFIRYLGQEDYTGYRPYQITPTTDKIRKMNGNTGYFFEDKSILLKKSSDVKASMESNNFKQAVEGIEKLAYHPNEQSIFYLLSEALDKFIWNFAPNYTVLIPIKTNKDAMWFDKLESFINIQITTMLTDDRWLDGVLNRGLGSAFVNIPVLLKKGKKLDAYGYAPQGYTIKQVFYSACEYHAKMIDLFSEYVFYNTFYLASMRKEQGISDDFDMWSIAGTVPSFSPVAGFEIERDYGIINTHDMSELIFISPLSRGEVKLNMEHFWGDFSAKCAKKEKSEYPPPISSSLKRNNLWS